MKIWPIAIITAFVLFAFFIGSLVRMSIKADVELVRTDYYEQEIKYQDQIDRVERTNELGDDISINFEESKGMLSVQLPNEGKIESGQLLFYRPSDKSKDRNANLRSVEKQRFDMSRMEKGLWIVKLSFTLKKKEYYKEQRIYIN